MIDNPNQKPCLGKGLVKAVPGIRASKKANYKRNAPSASGRTLLSRAALSRNLLLHKANRRALARRELPIRQLKHPNDSFPATAPAARSGQLSKEVGQPSKDIEKRRRLNPAGSLADRMGYGSQAYDEIKQINAIGHTEIG